MAGRRRASRCSMFPNGSGGTGRFAHLTGRLRLSRELDKISNRSANRRTRRDGNGIGLFMGAQR